MAKTDRTFIDAYTLRSKDIPLVEFSLYRVLKHGLNISSFSYMLQIDKIYNEHSALFPKDFFSQIDADKLMIWIKRRKAPKNRAFVDKILSAFEDDGNATAGRF